MDPVELSAVDKVRAYVRRIHGQTSHVRSYTRKGRNALSAAVAAGLIKHDTGAALGRADFEAVLKGKPAKAMPKTVKERRAFDTKVRAGVAKYRQDRHKARNTESAAKAAGLFGAAENAELDHLSGMTVRSPKQEARRVELLGKWWDDWTSGDK